MNAKAKGEFLKKISTSGFSITEENDTLILRPRGAEATAEVAIREVEPDVWRVVSSSGNYAGFSRGKKRQYFENNLNQWVAAAVLQTSA